MRAIRILLIALALLLLGLQGEGDLHLLGWIGLRYYGGVAHSSHAAVDG